jgi:hypothetical protein
VTLSLQTFYLVSHLSIPRFSTANRLAEQTADYKRQHGSFSKVPRRFSTQLSGNNRHKSQEDDTVEFEEELQLRADSLDDRNVIL